jgi:Pyridoxamine 5'-phosphate oxidase
VTPQWEEIAQRLRPPRSYWLGTTGADGAPHATPVWGVVVDEVLYVYSERRTVKARNVARNPRVVVHLDDGEDVLIVHGHLDDLGRPQTRPDVVDAFAAKYDQPGDAQYLPSADPAFDVLWALRPTRALSWRLADYAASQSRWNAEQSDGPRRTRAVSRPRAVPRPRRPPRRWE